MKENPFSSGQIILYSGSVSTRTFQYIPAESATARGSIPYGTNLQQSGTVVTAYDSDGTDVTSLIIHGTPTVANNVITVTFKYPGTPGTYRLKIKAALDNGDFDVRPSWDLIFAYEDN